jgi:hypothetical protein
MINATLDGVSAKLAGSAEDGLREDWTEVKLRAGQNALT